MDPCEVPGVPGSWFHCHLVEPSRGPDEMALAGIREFGVVGATSVVTRLFAAAGLATLVAVMVTVEIWAALAGAI